MKPAPFDYFAPTTREEALALLSEHGGEAKPLAGGQSLVPSMNFRLAQPAALVDLNGVGDLAVHRRHRVAAEDGGPAAALRARRPRRECGPARARSPDPALRPRDRDRLRRMHLRAAREELAGEDAQVDPIEPLHDDVRCRVVLAHPPQRHDPNRRVGDKQGVSWFT